MIPCGIKRRKTIQQEGKWYEYVVRFVFGGLATALAGLIAKEWGPVVGWLFLAFPAIFPASATLVETHERKRKEQHGVKGGKRGRNAAGVDAAGAALGSIGLAGFGGVSVVAWIIRKKL